MRTAAAREVSVVLTVLLSLPLWSCHAGWLDWLQKKPDTGQGGTTPLSVAALSQDEIAGGLREALSKGVQQAVGQLGKEGGFLNNLDVKIPMPESLQKVEKALRIVGQDKLADDFVATMNHAAEKAVPEAAAIFADSISKMSIEDAKGILTGPQDAATQYFRKTSEAKLAEKFLRIVKDATQKVGVTSAYKSLMDQAGPATQFLGRDAGDLDGYITKRSLDGLFKMIAVQEKSIRENPVARSTDLLKKVFCATLK